jgi:hypothetical protein
MSSARSLVGSEDHDDLVELNRKAIDLFHEPGALETVAHLAADWFTSHLALRGDTA